MGLQASFVDQDVRAGIVQLNSKLDRKSLDITVKATDTGLLCQDIGIYY